MKISIKREKKIVHFEVPNEDRTLLQTLSYIKEKIDPSLNFSKGCKSEICGCCAVMVDGKAKLACGVKSKDDMLIEPLYNHKVKRDLITNKDFTKVQKTTQAYLDTLNKEVTLTKLNEKKIELQSSCIGCSSCYASCPVLVVNKEFIGPFMLTKVLRYFDDVKESAKKQKIDKIQQNGIWDCTLCGECSIACPQGISSKDDILQLRMRSAMFGYNDPNQASFDSFGFDPSGF